jgi:GxxExxY protein
MILELKAVPKIYPNEFKQVNGYLRVTKLKLGILANFHGRSLKYYRILNSKSDL